MARRDDDEPDSLEHALAPRAGRRLRALALGALALAVCAGVVGGLYYRSLTPAGRATARQAPRPNVPCPMRASGTPRLVTVQPDRDGVGLVDNLAWSPSGTCIAALATRTTLSGATGAPILATFDSASGRLLSEVPLDAALRSALARDRATAAALNGLNVIYENVLWLPDGHHLAITLTAYTPDNYTPRQIGVLALDDVGLHDRAMLLPIGSAPSTVEWDLATGAGRGLPALSPALDYRWALDGTLLPGTALNTSAPPSVPARGPVGNPDGGTNFTVWQPGLVYIALVAPSPGVARLPGAYVWQTQYTALAPDGRYLISGLGVTGRLEPRGHPFPTQPRLEQLQLAQTPVLPVRDLGLETILDGLNPLGPPVSETPTILSWSPDGKQLAARPAYITFGATTPHMLDLYDCASGRLVASLGAGLGPGTAFGDGFQPRWSPDGTRLAAYDFDVQARVGTLRIWNVADFERPA